MRVRLAAWGAASLAVAAASFLPPIRATAFHQPLALLALLGGYLLLSFDPPVRSRRQFHFQLAGAVAIPVGVFIVIVLAELPAVRAVAHLAAVAAIALPLWLFARPVERGLFVAAAALAAANEFVSFDVALLLLYAGYGAAMVAAALCAVRLASPTGTIQPVKGPTRVVRGRDVMTLTQDQKAQRIAALDARFEAGEIPEHVYWDRRQEIESR